MYGLFMSATDKLCFYHQNIHKMYSERALFRLVRKMSTKQNKPHLCAYNGLSMVLCAGVTGKSQIWFLSP